MPEGKGSINQKGLDFYKRFIDEILKNGMVPNATVYHWDLPYELERMGGWLNRDIVNWYGEFAPGRKLEKYGRQANHHPLRKDSKEDIALAALENEKTYRSYLNPIFRGTYSKELLQYMEQNECMPDIGSEDLKLINQPLDFFGLVHTNFDTQKRTCKDSGRWYRDMIQNRGVNL